jgi:hypothetical protein
LIALDSPNQRTDAGNERPTLLGNREGTIFNARLSITNPCRK